MVTIFDLTRQRSGDLPYKLMTSWTGVKRTIIQIRDRYYPYPSYRGRTTTLRVHTRHSQRNTRTMVPYTSGKVNLVVSVHRSPSRETSTEAGCRRGCPRHPKQSPFVYFHGSEGRVRNWTDSVVVGVGVRPVSVNLRSESLITTGTRTVIPLSH